MASAPPPPPLHLLATLPSPSGHGTRAWQSSPHPSRRTPLLATASSDKSVHVWSLRDFRLLSTISGGHKRSVRCVQWKDYGTRAEKKDVVLGTGSFDANVGIWVHNDQTANATASDGDAKEVESDNEIDISKQGKVDADEEEWHFSTLLTGPDSEIKSISFSPPHYSASFLATSSRDKSVWVWEEVEDEEWETVAVLGDHTGDVKCVAWCTGAEDRSGGEDTTIIGSREILASGSYDDTIRLWRDVEEEGDWICVGVIDGHKGTVWDVCWEGHINTLTLRKDEDRREWEPRLLSCSDDLTVRVWRRELSESEREKKRNAARSESASSGGPRLPSIIRPPSNFENWVEDSVLPELHVRSVYAVDWSRSTGLVVSGGGDGAIAVYREVALDDDVMMNGTSEHDQEPQKTKWVVVALVEAAHDEFEVNHVCWAKRRDPGKGHDDEEVIVSTADDGDVKIWTLPEAVGR